jgi:hypothetical protein
LVRSSNAPRRASFCEFLKSCRCESNGFKGSVELLAEPDVVLIDRSLDFGSFAVRLATKRKIVHQSTMIRKRLVTQIGYALNY